MSDELSWPVDTFVRCDRAWQAELAEPAWYYIIEPGNFVGAVLLKGKFKEDQQFRLFERVDCTISSKNCRRTEDGGIEGLGDYDEVITREYAVPPDEVPEDVMAAFVKWRMLGEPRPSDVL